MRLGTLSNTNRQHISSYLMQMVPNSAPPPSVPRMGRLKLRSMTASGRTHRIHRWLHALLALWIMVLPAATAQAWPWGGEGSGDRGRAAEIVGVSAPSGRLQEVSPPGAVQQLQAALSSHTPRLELISPSDGSLLSNGDLQVTLRIEDWPLAEDPQLGLGAHVALQIDDAPPVRIAHSDNDRVEIRVPDLSPGSHRFTAYAAMPWGEAVKSPGASLQWRLDLLQGLAGTQPEPDAPWLAVVSPSDLGSSNPLLLDWLIWNAPLQNLREGDGRWRLRISVNGDSFLVDRQEALWLKAAGNGISSVQMELLDGLGDPITPVFNNQLRATQARPGARPAWMQSKLSDEQMARLLGDAIAEEQQEPEQNETQPENARPESSTQGDTSAEKPATEDSDDTGRTDPSDRSEPVRNATTDQAVEAEGLLTGSADGSTGESETVTGRTDEEASDRQASERGTAAIEPVIEPERLRITSSLGGSARELLNDDGTQR